MNGEVGGWLHSAGWRDARTNEPETAAMMITSIREGSRFGSCNLPGELVAETRTRYI